MRVTFRVKLLGIAAISAIAFVAIVVAGAVIAARVDGQVASIEHRYLPKMALEPRLEADLERLERGFQDAVAARDPEALVATREQRTHLFQDLDAAGDAVDRTEGDALRRAVEDYFLSAFDVSQRLMAGETGEAIVDAMKAMQRRQVQTLALLKEATTLDRADVTSAFDAVRRAEAVAGAYRLGVGVTCLIMVVLLSLAVSRSLLRSVLSLSRALERFGRGDFAELIAVSGRDELAELAHHANDMAASLQASNRELEAFSYSVAHDLRTPLRGINGLSRVLVEDHGPALDSEAHKYLDRIVAATERMGHLIDALLSLSRVARVELRREPVNLSRVTEAVVAQLRGSQPERDVTLIVEPNVVVQGDAPLIRALLENLLGNAWKFTGNRRDACISVGIDHARAESTYFVRDNGAGFDMAYANKLFTPFQRLHTQAEFTGTGIGLATVQRIVHRHGGHIWAEGAVGDGATFRFTLSTTSPKGLSS